MYSTIALKPPKISRKALGHLQGYVFTLKVTKRIFGGFNRF